MRITSVYLNNFLNHAETTIELQRTLTIVRGPNGAGKTAIRDAIRWAFTGYCRGMEQRNEEHNLIREGTKGAEVRVDFQHGTGDAAAQYLITRKASDNASTLVLSKDGDVAHTGLKPAQEAIYKLLGATEALMAHLFDAFELAGLSDRQRKETIQGLFTSDSPEKLQEYLVASGHEKLAQTDHMDAILTAYSTTGIEAASAYAVEQRRMAKRELKALVDPEAPANGAADAAAAETIQGEIDEAQERKATLNQTIPKLERMAALKDTIEGAKAKFAPTETPRPDAELDEAIAIAARVKDGTRVDLEVIQEQAATSDTGRLGTAIQVVEELGDQGSQKTLKSLKEKFTGANEVGVEDTPLQEAQKTHQMAVQAHEEAIADKRANEDLKQAAARAETSGQEWQAELNRLKKEVGDLEIDAIVKELADLDTAIASLFEQLSQAKSAGDYEARKQAVTKQRGQLHTRIDNWDSVCGALDPKNPKLAALFSDGRARFETLFTNLTALMGLKASVTEDYGLQIQRTSGAAVAWLAASEQYRVGAVLLVAICEQIDFNTIVLDWGDVLFEKAKQDFVGMLRGLSDIGMNAMLFATGPPESGTPAEDMSIHGILDGALV